MKKAVFISLTLLLCNLAPIHAMSSDEDEEAVEMHQIPRQTGQNIDQETLDFLKSAQYRWLVARHVFSTAESILDAFAYVGVMFSQNLTEDQQRTLAYVMGGIAAGKLLCMKLVVVSKERKKQIKSEILEARSGGV